MKGQHLPTAFYNGTILNLREILGNIHNHGTHECTVTTHYVEASDYAVFF